MADKDRIPTNTTTTPPVAKSIDTDNFNPMPIVGNTNANKVINPSVGTRGPEQPLQKDKITEEEGLTGTIIVGGILSGVDYNPDLVGTKRIDIYDEMRKGDATVRAALLAVKLPILAANWYINPVSDSKKDKDVAEFVENQLFYNMEYTWNDWLRHALLYLDYGSQVFEKVWKINDDGTIGWKKWAPRLSKTIYRWTLLDGQTPGITQILPVGGLKEIPSWKLIQLVNEQEGLDFEGISILRPAYQHWLRKKTYYNIDAIATERQGLGYPVVTVPPNATAEDRAKVAEMLKNWRANEQSYAQIPTGFSLEFLDTKATQLKNPKDMIMHHDRQISKSVLAQFLELGATQAGSFALSSNQSELFLLSEQAVAKYIQERVNPAIKELVDLNFTVDDYPTLEVGRIGTIDFKMLSEAIRNLAQAGFLVPDQEIERYIRNVMDLPESVQTTEEEHINPNDAVFSPMTMRLLQAVSQAEGIQMQNLVKGVRETKVEQQVVDSSAAGTTLASPDNSMNKSTTFSEPGAVKKANDLLINRKNLPLVELQKIRHEIQEVIHGDKN